METRYNIHGHIFDFLCVPTRFIVGLSGIMLRSQKSAERWSWLLHKINPTKDDDDADKMGKFIGTMSKTQSEIYKAWENQYPKGMKMNVLTIDLRYMNAGKVRKPYIQQLDEALEVKLKNKDMMLSVMVDPRAEDLSEIRVWLIQNAKYVSALKMYPLVGYIVTDKRLDPFYNLCSIYGWPVIVHGTPRNAVHNRSRREVKRTVPRDFEGFKSYYSLKKMCGNFAHPHHIIQAAKENPNINFNIAHFYGVWRPEIIAGMHECKNLYSDMSFTFETESSQIRLVETMSNNPILIDRLLFGDDMYMIQSGSEDNDFTTIEKRIGTYFYNKISIANPKKFFKV